MSVRRTARKATTKLIREAERQGWTYKLTGGNHHRLTSPKGAIVIVASTSRNEEQHLKKTKSRLRKHGFTG